MQMTLLQQLLAELKSTDTNWDAKVKSADIIAEGIGQRAVDELVSLLQSNNSDTRNAAALALREIGDSQMVEPLFRAIQHPNNFNDRSTLVYALEKLDCSEYFGELFSLVLSDMADVRMAAATVFFSQGFMVDDNDIEIAKKKGSNPVPG